MCVLPLQWHIYILSFSLLSIFVILTLIAGNFGPVSKRLRGILLPLQCATKWNSRKILDIVTWFCGACNIMQGDLDTCKYAVKATRVRFCACFIYILYIIYTCVIILRIMYRIKYIWTLFNVKKFKNLGRWHPLMQCNSFYLSFIKRNAILRSTYIMYMCIGVYVIISLYIMIQNRGS